VRVHHLNCGTMCPRGALLLAGSGGLLEPVRLVAHCLLIEAGERLVLVDTGFGTGDAVDPKRLGAPFRALVRPVCQVRETALMQVRGLGLDPADVSDIVVTHLDLDHAGGLGDFPEARVHVFAPELAIARKPPLRERSRYLSAQWAHGPRWSEVGADGEDWFGFESVRVIPELEVELAMVPLVGHTAGHTGVAVREDDGWLLHCGDAYFHRHQVASPPSCPPGLRLFEALNAHDGKTRAANQERLGELARRHGDEVRLICSHDPELLDRERAGK
jgi:glyoxylase-like metal-dependent hydrolase (beta-lactamase superfamily II)